MPEEAEVQKESHSQRTLPEANQSQAFESYFKKKLKQKIQLKH